MKAPKAPAVNRCSLILNINGVAYRVRMIEVGPPFVRGFRLTRPDGEFHDISVRGYGAECTCGDFEFRRQGLDPAGCKHIKAARAVGLID